MFRKSYMSSVLATILLASSLQGADTTLSNGSTSKISVTNGSDNITVTSSGDLNVTNDNAISVATTDYSGAIDIQGSVAIHSTAALKEVIKFDNINITSSGSVTNSGTITGSGNRMYGAITLSGANKVNSGTITNSGTISSTSYGISTVDATNDGTMTNSGTIEVSTAGFKIDGLNSGTVSNSGTITLTDSGSGIVVKNNTGSVLNSGTINISTGSAIEISSDNNGTITTTGNINVVDGSNSNIVYLGNDNNGVVNVLGDSNTTIVNELTIVNLSHKDNNGTINIAGTHNMGISGGSTASFSTIVNGVSNRGTIESNATIISDSALFKGIYLTGENNGTITNNGAIDSTNQSSYLIALTGANNGEIVNNGDINFTNNGSGDSYFIQLYDRNDGNVTNSATVDIDSTDDIYGIEIVSEVGQNGNVINSGTLDFNATTSGKENIGIVLYSITEDGSNITNSGTINITSKAGYSNGIYLFNDNNGTVTNSGTISTVSTQQQDTATSTVKNIGIKVRNNNLASLINSGTISSTSNGATQDDIGILASGNGGTILNSGDINITTPGNNASGININNKYTNSNGTIYNTGNIIITDTNLSLDNNFTGIYYQTTKETLQNIENNGTISIGNDGSVGIQVVGIDNKNSGTIVNNGTITAQTAIKIVNSDANITNSGTLNGNVESDSNGTLINSGTINGNVIATYFDMTNTGTVDGNVSVKSFVNNANGTVSGTITSTNGITNNGTITADTLTVNGTLTNNSNITAKKISIENLIMSDNSTLKLSSTSASTVTNLTLGESTTMTFNVYADGTRKVPNISGSSLSVSSSLAIPDSTTISFDVTANDGNQTILGGRNTIDIITATSIDANLSKIKVTDNSALLDFALQYSDDTKTAINAEMTLNSMYNSAKNTTTKGAYGAGRMLDKIGNITGNDDMLSYMDYVTRLATDEEVSIAVLSTTPTNTTYMPIVSTKVQDSASNIVNARVNSVGGGNSGEEVFSDKNLWVKPFGGNSEQDNKDGYSGFSADYVGIGIGSDGEYSDGKRAGVSLFFTRTNIDTNKVDQTSKVNSFNLIAYHNQNIIDKDTNLLIELGAGVQRTNTSRYVSGINKTASAKYTAINYMAKATIGRDYKISDKLYMKPSLSMSLSHYKSPDYSESGAGGMSLSVSGFRTNTMLMGLENLATYSINKKTNLTARVGAKYDLDNSAQTVSSSYSASTTNSFVTEGIKSSVWSYEAGLGINRDLSEDVSFDVDYNFDGKTSGFESHMVSAKFNYKF